MNEFLLAAGSLQVDDVITVVGSICVGLTSLALGMAFFVFLKNRGHRPEPALEGPALPPVGWTGAKAAPVSGGGPVISVEPRDAVSDTKNGTQKPGNIRPGED